MVVEKIGVIEHFFTNISVAAIRITAGTLNVGDTIHVVGAHTDFTQKITSMQIERNEVQSVSESIPIYGELESSDSTPSSLIPIISSAVEASKRAGATSLRETQDQLAAMGLTGTPFADAILASARTQSAYDTSQIAPNITSQFLQMIPSFITGTGQTIVSAGTGLTSSTSSGSSDNLSLLGNLGFNIGG